MEQSRRYTMEPPSDSESSDEEIRQPSQYTMEPPSDSDDTEEEEDPLSRITKIDSDGSRVHAAFIILIVDGHVVCNLEKGRSFGFAGGSMNRGESYRECAVRELAEELGVVMPRDFSNLCSFVRSGCIFYVVRLDNVDMSGFDTREKKYMKEVPGYSFIPIDTVVAAIKAGSVVSANVIHVGGSSRREHHRFRNCIFKSLGGLL